MRGSCWRARTSTSRPAPRRVRGVNAGPDHAVEVPAWFDRALAVPFTDEYVGVAGAAVHYVAWGRPGPRGLVFVHGGAAHAHWWTRSEEHTSELQSLRHLVCRLLLE